MSDVTWRVIRAEEWLLELEGSDCTEVTPAGAVPIYNWWARVKWDGCTEIERCFNFYGHAHQCDADCRCGRQSWHWCDLGAAQQVLAQLQRLAAVHFGHHSP